MCLILFAQNAHPDYPLVFAGNRDEFYDRPTVSAAFWDEAPHVLGGRDLKAGGTWLGVTKGGYWATVTNVRDQGPHRENAPSRGHEVPARGGVLSVRPLVADVGNGCPVSPLRDP